MGTLQVHFVTTIVHLIHKHGRYNVLEQIQHLVQHFQAISTWKGLYIAVTGLFLSNENTIEPAVDLLALVLREASRDR